VISPLEIVRCLRFGKRWSVPKCRSNGSSGKITEDAVGATLLFTVLERSTLTALASLDFFHQSKS
jgi:hypothetical protein